MSFIVFTFANRNNKTAKIFDISKRNFTLTENY